VDCRLETGSTGVVIRRSTGDGWLAQSDDCGYVSDGCLAIDGVSVGVGDFGWLVKAKFRHVAAKAFHGCCFARSERQTHIMSMFSKLLGNDQDPQQVYYIFLDVVSFSTRSNNAQSAIIKTLNKLVKQAVNQFEIEEALYLPTGDGLCICLLKLEKVQVCMELACMILELISEKRKTEKEDSRKFEVRVGINENVDHLVEDINGNRNVAGAGINLAQRVMSVGDSSQLFLSANTHDIFNAIEPYRGTFKEYKVRIKHNLEITVYQYLGTAEKNGVEWLNRDVPKSLQPTKSAEDALTPRYDIRGLWYYAVYDLNGKEKMSGECRLALTEGSSPKNPAYSVIGRRRRFDKRTEAGQVEHVELDVGWGWQSIWSSLCHDNWFRFGYLIETGEGAIKGFGEVKIPVGDGVPQVLEGSLYQLPPGKAEWGQFRMWRPEGEQKG
jgi:class 3 adenylate cyclase